MMYIYIITSINDVGTKLMTTAPLEPGKRREKIHTSIKKVIYYAYYLTLCIIIYYFLCIK